MVTIVEVWKTAQLEGLNIRARSTVVFKKNLLWGTLLTKLAESRFRTCMWAIKVTGTPLQSDRLYRFEILNYVRSVEHYGACSLQREIARDTVNLGCRAKSRIIAKNDQTVRLNPKPFDLGALKPPSSLSSPF